MLVAIRSTSAQNPPVEPPDPNPVLELNCGCAASYVIDNRCYCQILNPPQPPLPDPAIVVITDSKNGYCTPPDYPPGTGCKPFAELGFCSLNAIVSCTGYTQEIGVVAHCRNTNDTGAGPCPGSGNVEITLFCNPCQQGVLGG